GITGPAFYTSDTIWDLTSLPARLLVVGGGSVGCELGQAFARLGSAVTIVEAGPRLLPREDPDAVALLASALRVDGIDMRTGFSVTGFAGSTVQLADGTRIEFDVALLATGRTPRTMELGLTEAGVEVDADGHVLVDRQLRTSNPRVWAAGDVTTYPPFTHSAGVYASTAASNAVLGLRRSVDPDQIPRVTFTQPEIAAIGIGAEQARQERLTIRQVEHRHLDRAVAEQHPGGFSRLVLDRRGRVVGATLVGPRAGEALAEVALAVDLRLRARALARSMHAYPTYADGVWNAAIVEVQAGLRRPAAQRVTRLLGRFRRRRVSR
ncbi:MAG: NAD(P)/FAD-dependent oxidoreductase, partial [Actinomycetota bacterium]|nr:NAD(P)/FAD-dependent oxidoreductase [Actinomycetota bacterium]